MNFSYNKEKIERVLGDFYNATGVSIQFFDNNLCSYGRKISQNRYCDSIKAAKRGVCRESDFALVEKCRITREAAFHICHAGLVDIAVPILYNMAIFGYIILGQMRKDDDFSAIADYITSLGLDCEVMKENYLSLQYYDDSKIQSILNIASIITKYILWDHMLIPGFNQTLQKAIDYIEENLHMPISIEDVASGAHVSKSTLYKYFKEVLGCTVGEFLMKKRIERAEKLLAETEMSVQDISEAVGFSSAAYFTANFKKAKGVPPLRFRKNKT